MASTADAGSSSATPAAAAAAKPAAQSYSTDPALYIYTSLTAGSSHIVTATSRLETILRANRVPFKAIDIATDEKARMLWGRRAGKDEGGRMRKLPGLVQMGMVLGDLVEIEEWNEYGELKQHVTIYYDEFTQPPIGQAPKIPPVVRKPPGPPAATLEAAKAAAPPPPTPPPAPAPKQLGGAAAGGVGAKVAETAAKATMPIRSVAEEAAQKAKQLKLQSLREKVHGKGSGSGSNSNSKSEAAADENNKDGAGAAKAEEAAGEKKTEAVAAEASKKNESQSSLPSVVTDEEGTTAAGAGMQSPTTGAWRAGSDNNLGGAPLRTVQSPTSTRWKPTDVDAPITSFGGSVVASASAEEIAALEKAETIEEKPEEEEEEDDDEEEEDDKEEEKDKEAEKVEEKKVELKEEAGP